MRRQFALRGTALVFALLVSGGPAIAAAIPSVAESARVDTVTTASSNATTQSPAPTEWGLASRTSDAPVVEGFAALAPAPAAAEELEVSLNITEQEQYWFWAYGVQVTAKGLQPGEEATISVILSSGVEKRWSTSDADANGEVVRRVSYLNLDPDNTHPDAGPAQIKVTAASGAVGAALFTIVPNEGESLTVTTEPPAISQDDFLDEAVTVTVQGFEPWDKVFFNLGLPDTSMGPVGATEGLHADADGVFTYELQAASTNSQVGDWLLSFQSDGDRQGTGILLVTEGRPRSADKSIAIATPVLSAEQFATSPGLSFALSGFTPFDSYELTLRTPRGGSFSLGLARSNGEGSHANSVRGPTGAPFGTYTVRAQSTTTGAYAEGIFTVDGAGGPREPLVTLEPASLAASAMQDSTSGTVLSGRELVPGTNLRISLRDSSWKRLALTAGADAYVMVGQDGTFRVALSTLEAPQAGEYTVWATSSDATLGYDLRLPLTVTADAIAEGGAGTIPPIGVDGVEGATVAPSPRPSLAALPLPSVPGPGVVPEDDEPVLPSAEREITIPVPVSPSH